MYEKLSQENLSKILLFPEIRILIILKKNIFDSKVKIHTTSMGVILHSYLSLADLHPTRCLPASLYISVKSIFHRTLYIWNFWIVIIDHSTLGIYWQSLLWFKKSLVDESIIHFPRPIWVLEPVSFEKYENSTFLHF